MAGKDRRKLIYILRAQCEPCNLDKMKVFYRIPNSTPTEMFEGNKLHLTERFRDHYKCSHDITFTKEIDKTYVWDLNEGKAVKK